MDTRQPQASTKQNVESGRNQDIPINVPKPPPSQPKDPTVCSNCNKTHTKPSAKCRNLIVCLDGTANQFGRNNSNVLEFCSRIERNNQQEIYYLPGIGTVPETKPSLGQRYDQVLDLAFAHTFDQRVLAGYRWLSNTYKFGDKIFIYGAPPREVDTVASIGFGRTRPGTNNLHEYVCFIRHALALDEIRVKFLPEYLFGGNPIPDDVAMKLQDGIEKVKEVWFSGSHSDVGGGNKPNEELNNGSVPVLWMVIQSSAAGLAVTPSRVNWVDDALRNMRPKSPMNVAYKALEFLPFNRKTYKGVDGKTWRPHMSKPRIIRANQKIHISTCFIEGYEPLAKFERGTEVSLEDIVGKGVGKENRLDWIPNELKKYIETDLFDISQIPDILHDYCTTRIHPEGSKVQLERLGFLACVREGAQAILKHDLFPKSLCQLIADNSPHAFNMLHRLIEYGLSPIPWFVVVIETRSLESDSEQYLITLPNLIEFVEEALPNATFETVSPILDILVQKYGRELPLEEFREISKLRTSFASQDEDQLKPGWLYTPAIASLYFSRSRRSGSNNTALADLVKAQSCLRAFPLAESSSVSAQTAIIQNCLATTLESEPSSESIRRAVEIRIRLVDQLPNETYHRDLANTVLTLASFKVHQHLDDAFDISPYVTTRSKRDVISSDKEYASLLSNLSNRLHDLGMDEALEVARASISIFRHVFPGPLVVDADMATALNNLSNRLADEGQYEEALKVIEEAVRMRRELSKGGDIRCKADLAISLANLSRRQHALGQWEGAQESAQEAVDIHRRLFRDNPDGHREDFSSSLLALSIVKDSLRRLEESLEIGEEVVRLREFLANKKPAAFNALLARSLTNLAISYTSLRRLEDALVASQRAASLQEPLAKARPDQSRST
ncbi:hypothetical protein NLI96_g10956 [Meripilus lineatus]|uniref:T6SS Phospholipase effector Tle1-like catalytic domain-containing protein n=1 Tax=Meripilus lineatus TaxID=2056292 RepID=A0AAD5Y9L3_9APHY|nr:hypothetical protein NLI96_g10956 [Physisporinus lineatus]